MLLKQKMNLNHEKLNIYNLDMEYLNQTKCIYFGAAQTKSTLNAFSLMKPKLNQIKLNEKLIIY